MHDKLSPLKIIMITLCVINMALFSSASRAQEVSWIVSGRVLEKGTTKPLEGVILSVNEVNSLTTISDENGNFVLKFTEKGKYTVFASLIGAEQTESRVITLEKDVLPRKLTFYLLVTTVLPEIVVNAERNPNRVSKNVIKGEELRQVAGSSGDPLKAIQSLPGIAMANGTSSAPAIRGSGPGDNYYYADSVPVGKVFHYGGISVFNGDLIETFNLYSAAFAPNYDNVTGAILDISLRNPRSDRLGGKINISLTGADFLIEGPTSGNQSFYFAARRSYFDLLIHTVERKGVILQIPNYSDYQGKYIWNVNFDNSVTLQATGAADSLKLNVASDSDLAKTQPDLAGTITAQDSSATQAIVWDTKLPSSINNKLVVGRRTSQAVNNVAAAGNVYVDSNTVFVREQMIIPLKESHDLTLATSSSSSEVGLDLNFKNTNCTQFNTGCDLSSAPLVQLEDRFHIISWDVAAQDRWRLVPRFTLVGGVRHSQENYLNQAILNHG